LTIRVGVLGAAGRMGSEVCRTLEADPELDLVAQVDLDDSIETLVESGAEVAVDFTAPDAVKDNVLFCLANGIHAVVGTTGMSQEDLREIERATGKANAFVAPNFALGAVLMMAFARQAAPHFRNADVIERHHEKKLDAPSGTAMRTAEMMNEARGSAWQEVAGSGSDTSRGLDVEGVRVHSVRSVGSVAHQEVVFGGPGETLTIRHDSIDRASFMPGVVLAVKNVKERPGLTVGLENLLGL
jgi:4-hydroxy-tetrahydrodipicolinate reductase